MIRRLPLAAAVFCFALAGLCRNVCAFSFFNKDTEEKNSFDLGEKDDLKKGVVIKDQTESDRRAIAKRKQEKVAEKTAKTIQFHIKQLKAKEWEDRATSAEYLGVLNAYDAIPDLIDVLNPRREERDAVARAAHGSLLKLTGKNIGVKNYSEWNDWWIKNKVDFIKQKKNEVPETDRIAAESANTQGLEYMKLGEYRMALQQFLVALDKNTKVPDYHNNAGLSVLELGRPVDAMEYFQETIGMNPDLPQPYLNIGRCYSRMDRTIEAQAWFKKAIDRDKKGALWDIYWMTGKEYLRHGDYKGAIEYLDLARTKMEQRRIKDPRVYNDLAICHYGLDQYHSAWKELCNVRYLGFEPNPDFEGKVRKVLIENGVDPDEEDRLVREHLKELQFGAGDEVIADKVQAKPESIIDSVKQK